MKGCWWRSGAFRRARPAPAWWNLGKTGLQIVVFWTVFLLIIPRLLAALERHLAWPAEEVPAFKAPVGLAWTVFALASALGLWSGFTMAVHGAGTPLPLDAPRRLVVGGPYRYVRNPMAVAGLSQGAAVAALLGSWLTVGLVVSGFVVWNYFVRPFEERDLADRFGADYAAYRRSVRCWIPLLPGYRSPGYGSE